MRFWQLIFRPKRVEYEDVAKAEAEYDQAFINWCSASTGAEEMHFNRLLDMAALNMNKIKKKREKWLKYNGDKG